MNKLESKACEQWKLFKKNFRKDLVCWIADSGRSWRIMSYNCFGRKLPKQDVFYLFFEYDLALYEWLVNRLKKYDLFFTDPSNRTRPYRYYIAHKDDLVKKEIENNYAKLINQKIKSLDFKTAYCKFTFENEDDFEIKIVGDDLSFKGNTEHFILPKNRETIKKALLKILGKDRRKKVI